MDGEERKMFSKKQIAEYSSMDIEDGNKELIEFYENHFHSFTKCSVKDFENHVLVLRKLAEKLHTKLEYPENWKIFASEMGILDNDDIDTIQASAETRKEMPLFLTMAIALPRLNVKLANVIKALLNLERYDALKFLYPHVQILLEKMNAPEKRELVSNKRISCLENKFEDFSLQPFKNKGNPFTLALKTEFSTDHPNCKVESLQKNIYSSNSITESKSLPCLNPSEQNCKEPPMQKVDFFPSAPPEDSLSVFIQHTEHDLDVAKELSCRMNKLGITVRTSYEIDLLIPMDSTGALSTILQEVDFIVPVVSKQFLQQIHPYMFANYIDSSDAMSNRTLYQLMNTQYQSNKCVNFKVRSVLLPDIDRRMLIRDAVLFYGLKLWEEFPKLVRILKETKSLISQYPFY